MGREVKRVPVDFDWPTNEVWQGFLRPNDLEGVPCLACNASGQTHFGWWMQNVMHLVAMLATDVHEQAAQRPMHPWLQEFSRAHGHFEYLHDGEWTSAEALHRGGMRPGQAFREMSSRFVVDRPGEDALKFFHGILRSHYAHRFAQDDEYAKYYNPDTLPPVEQVGGSIGHSSGGSGSGNIQSALLDVLASASGVDFVCPECNGEGATEAYEGQFAARDAWEPSDPPTGEGWQLWETVSEGSPVSPVFPDAEGLAQWLTTPEGGKMAGPSRRPMAIEQARGFVGVGWAPSGFIDAGGVHDGAEYVGTSAVLRELEDDGS